MIGNLYRNRAVDRDVATRTHHPRTPTRNVTPPTAAPISLLQSQPRCSVCGTKGAYTVHPSIVGGIDGLPWQPFPPERWALFCHAEELELPMCNSYAQTKGQAAIIALTRALRDTTGNLPPLPGIFPDYFAPVVRNAPDGVRELAMLRWGMPGPPQFGGAPITNIRNAKSPHWRAWLQPANRCVVPFTSFCEWADTKPKKTATWFAFDENRPLAFFAGIWTTWRGKRGPKSKPVEGEHQLFGFLTTDANAEVVTIHPKAMPAILRTENEIETWLTAPADEALKLQRPLPDQSLKIVMTGEKEDSGSIQTIRLDV